MVTPLGHDFPPDLLQRIPFDGQSFQGFVETQDIGELEDIVVCQIQQVQISEEVRQGNRHFFDFIVADIQDFQALEVFPAELPDALDLVHV